MSIQRPRTPRDLVRTAGVWPKAAAGAVALALLAGPALAQAQTPGAPAEAPKADGPRNPLKGGASKDAKVVVSEHMTVDLHVKDEDLANVLELLSIQTQKNIIASNKVGGKVTATLYGVTFYQALDAILHVNGFGYTENGNFIYVYTKDELAEIQKAQKKRVSRVIRLNYLNAEDAKEFVTPLLSKDGGEIRINAKVPTFNIPDKSPVGKNDFALTDTMVIIDFEENVKAVEELVRQIDTRPAQVLVEATILQTALNEANAFGVDFSVIGDLNFGDFVNIGGPLGAAAGLIRGGTGAAGQGFSPPNDRGNAVTSTPGNTSGPGTFKVGVLAGDVAIFLRMLDQVTDTVILSNPKILALNRQPARVLVGKRVGYLNTTSTETSTTQTVEFLDTGTQLYFRPFVSSEGEVRMELKPQVSAAEIRNVTDARGATVTIPDEVTQELVTNVNVRDGQTVVLGGLFTENTTFTRRQVPWAGDLPIIGAAFRGNEDSTTRSEIIFLITPTIVTDTMLAGAADRATGDIERVRTGTRQGLLPWSREKMTDTLNVEAEKLAREGDFDKALWNIQRSLSMNPNQPEAYRLRERITGMRERWGTNSMLEDIINSNETRRQDFTPPSPSPSHRTPRGSVTPQFDAAPAPRPVIPPSAYVTEQQTLAATLAAAAASEQNASQPAAQPAPEAQAQGHNDANTQVQSPSADTPAQASVPADQPMTPDAGQPDAPSNNNSGDTAAASAEPHAQLNVSDLNQAFAQVSGTSAGHPAPDAIASPVSADAHTPLNAPFASGPMPVPATVVTPVAVDNAGNAAQPAVKPYVVPNLSADEKKSVAQVTQTLPGLRGHVELFTLMNSGTLPELGNEQDNGWNALLAAGQIKTVPANPYVGGPNAQKIVVGDKPDTTFHNDYGWIYNPKTGQLWAAGFDASDRPLCRSTSMDPTLAAKPATPATDKAPDQGAEAKPQNPEPATAGVETKAE
jgi:type IV pilus secretin PilQ/predicted competence protein